MEKKVHRMLRIAADMQAFAPQEDKLERMTKNVEMELNEDDLDFVAAAAAEPRVSFQEFLKRNGR